jgi:hypothetical protein
MSLAQWKVRIIAHRRSRHRVVSLAVVLSLCLVQMDAQQRPLDLSATKAEAMFNVPKSVWIDINSFVFLVAFDSYTPGAMNTAYPSRFGKLAAYPRLRAAARVWGTNTFPRINNIAGQLTKGDIRTLLLALDSSIKKRNSDPVAAQAEFDSNYKILRQRFTTLKELTAITTAEAKELNNAGRAAIAEYERQQFPDNQWVKIGPRLKDVQTALALMNSQWGALISDLDDLQQRVTKGNLVGLDIRIGLRTWDDIQKSAAGFITDMPAQQKYLTGDNYYDNCSIDENAYYEMTNLFVAARGLVLASDGTADLKMMARPLGSRDSRVEWRFRRIGSGWFRIENRARGALFALDTGKMAKTGNYTGQYWRCMPTQYVSRIRLINSFQGEFRSLDSSQKQAFMAPTENVSGQYWRFSKVGP